MTPEEQMLISAVRYALGRQSYITGVTCDFVRSIAPKLSDKCLNIMSKDIMDELVRYHKMKLYCGMEMDDRAWQYLLDFLRDERNKR